MKTHNISFEYSSLRASDSLIKAVCLVRDVTGALQSAMDMVRAGLLQLPDTASETVSEFKKILSEEKIEFTHTEVEAPFSSKSFKLKSLPTLAQRQDSVTDQLNDLLWVANRLGMYDAVDLIKRSVNQA
jgi:hypothetical protein